MSDISLGTVYEINKELMKNEKPLDYFETQRKIKEVAEYMFEKASYFMLLSNENKDYTVFDCRSTSSLDSIIRDLKDCLGNRGTIYSIDIYGANDYEIWIKIDDEFFVYYLFDYSWGVITCE